MGNSMAEKAYTSSRRNTRNLNDILHFSTVMAENDIYTIDMIDSSNKNIAIEILDTNDKEIKVINVPESTNGVTIITLELKVTHSANITYFPGIIWQNGNIPFHLVGKTYFEAFISYDNGSTWRGFSAGAW